MKRYTAKKAGILCNKVLNAARKVKYPHPGMINAWQDDAGRTFVCDGYRAYRLNSAPEGLSEVWTICDSNAVKMNDAQRARAAIERMFDALNGDYIASMPAPDADSVVIASRNSIYDISIIFDLGADYPAVNAKYLRDVMELLPGAKWFFTDSNKRMTSPIYAESINGAAILLPIRTKSKLNWQKPA